MTTAGQVTQLLFRLRWILLVLFLILILGLASGIAKLQFSSDSRNFLGKGTAEYADLVMLDETYTQFNTTLLMISPPGGDIFAPESLQVLRQMTQDAWQIPYVLRVDSAVNQMHTFAENEDVFVEPMLDDFAEITSATAARFKERAMNSTQLSPALLSNSNQVFGLAISVVPPADQPEALSEFVTALTSLRGDWNDMYTGWEIRATGALLGNDLLAQVARNDITRLVPLAVLVAMVLFALAIGSVYAIFVLLMVVGTSVVGTVGFAGWAGIALTAGTAISPMAVLVLVSTSCIHILISTIRAFEAGNTSDPLRQAIEKNLAPVSVSHLTTAASFLCLNFAPSPPLANMGNIVAFGLFVGQLSVFVLIPALLGHRPPTKIGLALPSAHTMHKLAAYVLANRRWSFMIFPVLGAIALSGIFRIGFDDNFFRYFDPKYEFRQDTDAIQTKLTGLDSLQFSFRAPENKSVFDPDFLLALDRFAIWLDAQPGVQGVSSLSKTIKSLNMSMSGDDPGASQIAPTQDANAQLMMFYELSLPIGMDTNSVISVDRKQTRLSATVRADHAEDLRRLAQEAEDWLILEEPAIATRASGASLAFARNSRDNNTQMLYGFAVALGVISTTLIITLRSVSYGVVSLVPNLFPALLTFGLWGWTLRDVNLGSTVVTTMTLGIVVDDTVHFLMYYLRLRRAGYNTVRATEETFATVGSSITLTSVVLIIGFSMMILSGFSINQHIGMLTAIVVLFALMSDLLFLPAILTKTRDPKR